MPKNLGDSEFRRAYEEMEKLGEGSFSCVHKVRLKEDGAKIEAERAKVNGSRGESFQSEEEFAVKKIERKRLNKKNERRVFDEVDDLSASLFLFFLGGSGDGGVFFFFLSLNVNCWGCSWSHLSFKFK